MFLSLPRRGVVCASNCTPLNGLLCNIDVTHALKNQSVQPRPTPFLLLWVCVTIGNFPLMIARCRWSVSNPIHQCLEHLLHRCPEYLLHRRFHWRTISAEEPSLQGYLSRSLAVPISRHLDHGQQFWQQFNQP